MHPEWQGLRVGEETDRTGWPVKTADFDAMAYRWSSWGFVPKCQKPPLAHAATPAWFVVVVASDGCRSNGDSFLLALTVTYKSQLMRNAYITGQGRGNIIKVLPDSKPVMDSKVLMKCTRGIKDVYSHFCLGSEKSPWKRALRWWCFLMLFLMIGTSMFIFYISSFQVSWPSPSTRQSHNNTDTGSVSMSSGLCHLERKATVKMTKEKSTCFLFGFLCVCNG